MSSCVYKITEPSGFERTIIGKAAMKAFLAGGGLELLTSAPSQDQSIQRSAARDVTQTPEFKRWSGGAPVVRLGESYDFKSGQPVVVESLHGTTNADLVAFDRERANIESDWGAGFYSSNTPEDVANNYANNDGADLTNRIELTAERLAPGFDDNMDAAREEAKKRLTQASPNTIKLYVRMSNPAVHGGNGETFFDYSEVYDEETDGYAEPTGLLVDFVEALRDAAAGFDESDADKAMGAVWDQVNDNGGIGLSDLVVALKSADGIVYATDGAGNIATSEIIRRALEGMGFDGVIDTTVSSKFDGMKGMDAGTVHFIAFEPTQLKSATGNGGQFDPDNPDITRSAARQTDTPEFKRWFGESKVVDEQGNPLVVYHGTVVRPDTERVKGMGDIQAFDRMFTTKFRPPSMDTVGSWFSTNPGDGGAEMYSGRYPGSTIYPVYLSIKNPQITTFQLMQRRARLLANGKDDGRQIGAKEVEAYRKWLQDTGKDGIKIEGSGNDESTEFDSQVAWIALEPEQIKSAVGNSGQFDPANSDITRSVARPEFFSQLQRSIEQVPDRLATMAAPQWKLWLDANAPKLGVKKDEIEWSGIKDYLTLRGKDKVTRDELAAYLADSGVRVQETVLGKPLVEQKLTKRQELAKRYDEAIDAAMYADAATNPAYIESIAADERKPEEQALLDAWNAVNENTDEPWVYDQGNPTKYDQYTVPGGDNYREVLITLPSNRDTLLAKRNAMEGRGALLQGNPNYEQDRKEYDALQARITATQDYKSNHWDAPNILAHLRVDDRTDADGNKVLFINEIQSDWGQDGKKNGFAGDVELTQADYSKAMATLRSIVNENDNLGFDSAAQAIGALTSHADWKDRWDVGGPENEAAVAEALRVRDQLGKQKSGALVPKAPFVTDTKAWASLALKRAIMMAVEGGYDRVALITGEQAAGLYSLDKQISKVEYLPETNTLRAFDPNGRSVYDQETAPDKIEDVIGKEVASKLLDSEPYTSGSGKKVHRLEGVDLKVPATGMRKFYDELVPQVARDVLKKLGGGKLQSVFIPGADAKPAEAFRVGEDGKGGYAVIWRSTGEQVSNHATREEAKEAMRQRRLGEAVEQPGFDITPAMREKVAAGVPLFSRRRAQNDGQYAAKISIDNAALNDVRAKYGPIEDWWKGELGHGFEGLTQSEARYMLNSRLSPEALRDRVAAARQAAGAGDGEEVAARLSKSRDVTDTLEFKRWFGDSKVVDSDGKPLVVYHGTSRNFAVFSESRSGENFKAGSGAFFFTPERAFAEQMAEFAAENDEAQDAGGPVVMPVYLSLKNPLVRDFNGRDIDVAAVIAEARAAGYDGVIAKNAQDSMPAWPETQYIAFRPEQIKSAVGNNGDFDPANQDIRRSAGRTSTGAAWDSPSASKFDDLVYKLQDKQIETKRIVEAIKSTGSAISDDLNVYLREELYHGRAAKRTEDFVNMELNPLVEQLAKDGLKLEDLEEFLHARHAPEANKVIAARNPGEPGLQDGGSGMMTADALQYMATLPADLKQKLESAAAKVDAIIGKTREMYVDYELESRDTVDGWGKVFQHYIPLQREDKNGSPGLGQGFSVKGRETKGRTGSKRKVVDILANIALQRERAIVRGEKNRVSQSLVGLATANPNPGFWEVDVVPTERVFNPETGLVEDRVDPLYKSRDNAVIAKIMDANGAVREHAVLFNEEDERALRMARALKNLDAAQLEGLMGVSAKISRYFASINTSLNPIFGVVNAIRDIQGVALNLSSTELKGDEAKVLRNTASALAGIYGDARRARKGRQANSKWAQLWDEFQEVGGQTGYRDLFRTSEDRANAIKKTLNPDAWMDSRLGKIFTAGGALKVPLSQARKAAGWLFDIIEDYNLAMENGVRLSVYKAGLDKGLSKELAASIAKNSSTNFNRRGAVGQQVGALYAFFNASVQGTARIGQTIFDMEPGKPKTIRLSSFGKKIVYGGILLGVAQALALAAAGYNDEDPPDFVRERSLIFPVGGGKYVTVPMPLGFNVIPNIGRMTAEFALSGFSKPEERAVKLISLFAEAFNPIGNAGLSMQTLAPTALDPLVALTENKDYTGKPIARTSSNDAIPGHALGRDTASSVSKFLSESINTISGGNKYVSGVFSPSPDQIEYLIGQLTGGVGRELSKIEQSALATARGEALPTYKIPLVGRFIGDTKSQASEGAAFYANSERLNRLETEIKGLNKDGKYAEAAELRRGSSEAYLITMANQAERQIQKLRAEKRELIKAGAPREKVVAIEERITASMARLNRAVDALREKQEN